MRVHTAHRVTDRTRDCTVNTNDCLLESCPGPEAVAQLDHWLSPQALYRFQHKRQHNLLGCATCQSCTAFKQLSLLAGYLMPEDQMPEEEEEEDDEMHQEYTPEMADELMRRGLILGGKLRNQAVYT